MNALCRFLVRATTLWLTAMAITGIIVPPEVVAQARAASAMAGLTADAKLHIEILEMDSSNELPRRFRVARDDGSELEFEWSDGGYAWSSPTDPNDVGFRAVPGLEKALGWSIQQGADGSFSAQLPLGDFEQDVPQGAPLKGTEPEAIVETFGWYDAEEDRVDMAALGPDGAVVDITVDFSALPGDVILGSAWSELNPPTKGAVIVIPFAAVLLILGIAALACATFHAGCYIACQANCTNGVKRVISAICGVSCTCECNSDTPPPTCTSSANVIETLSLRDDDPKIVFPKNSTTLLTRLDQTHEMHDGSEVSYLMGEWALLELGGTSETPTVIRSSSMEFARAKASSASKVFKSEAAAEPFKTLVLEYPAHEANSRKIAMPELVVRPSKDFADLPAGRVLVRADFQHRELSQLKILDSDIAVDDFSDLTLRLEKRLALQFASEKDHRVVVFAVLELDRTGVSIVRTLPYLPKCCCGTYFCA